MIYFDSSALMKLARPEAESFALVRWLGAREDEHAATSELGRVELLRAAGRLGAEALTEARGILGDVDLVPLDRSVQDLACEVGGPLLRTLDALHLASAQLLGDELTAFVTYDKRLFDAAVALSMPAVSPGIDWVLGGGGRSS